MLRWFVDHTYLIILALGWPRIIIVLASFMHDVGYQALFQRLSTLNTRLCNTRGEWWSYGVKKDFQLSLESLKITLMV